MKGGTFVFVHGLPGSPADARFAFPPARQPEAVLAPHEVEPYLARLAQAPDRAPVCVVAHSLGAFGALRAAARHPDAVAQLVLISPAAPLQLGDFLAHMAGAPVFRAARLGGGALRALTGVQALGVRIAPSAFARLMFASATPSERRLLDDPVFLTAFVEGLRASLLADRAAYLRTVSAYVADWTDALDHVRCPVTIVQGEEDSWTPPTMAAALAHRLGSSTELVTVPRAGHYGTLRWWGHERIGEHAS